MRVVFAAALVGCAAALGCGGDKPPGPQGDDEVLAALVTGTPDKALTPALAKEHFLAPPGKADLRRYAEASFEPAGRPAVSGETATVPVRVTAADGKPLGEVTWEFARDRDRWKLKSAPLP